MWISEQDEVFVSGSEDNIPEALANALRGYFGETLSIGCAWVRKRFVFLRVWADNAPENKQLCRHLHQREAEAGPPRHFQRQHRGFGNA